MEQLLILFGAGLGATSTFYLSQRFQISPVRSSAMVSLSVAIGLRLLSFLLKFSIPETYALAAMGGSFAGMASSQVFSRLPWVALAGGLVGFLFLSASQHFQGYGGALGTAASISVMAVMGFPIYLHKRKFSRALLRIRRWRKS